MTFADELTMREHLREKFPPEQIGKLPGTNKRPPLDYVGHAAVTDRLNRYAPDWTYTVDKLFNSGDSTWIEGTLTVGGVSRVEYGEGKTPKEAISDFVKRGAMRFGVALDLWSKEELDTSSAVQRPAEASQQREANTETTPSDHSTAAETSEGGSESYGKGGTGPLSETSSPLPSVEAGAPEGSGGSSLLHQHGGWSTRKPDGGAMRSGWVRCTNLLPNGAECGYGEKLSRVAKADLLPEEVSA